MKEREPLKTGFYLIQFPNPRYYGVVGLNVAGGAAYGFSCSDFTDVYDYSVGETRSETPEEIYEGIVVQYEAGELGLKYIGDHQDFCEIIKGAYESVEA